MEDTKVISCPECGHENFYKAPNWIEQDEANREAIVNLTSEQLRSEVKLLLEHFTYDLKLDEQYEDHFSALVRFRDIDTSEFAKVAYEKGIYFPCGLYKDAPEEIVRKLCALLEQDELDSFVANQILLCLSVAGARPHMRPLVYECFVKLHKQPRAWRAKLHVDPNKYAVYGGWSYDQDFNLVETQYPVCYSIVQGEPKEHAHSPVKLAQATEHEERCPVCKAKLFELIRIDGKDPRLAFLNIDGVIAIKCCLSCFYFDDDYFVSYDLEGNSQPLSQRQPDEYAQCYVSDEEYEHITHNTFMLGDKPTLLRYHAQWSDWASIGGFAYWIQDVEIKHCPKCGKPMKYVAQIPWSLLIDNAEGYGYVEICPDCQIAAVIHQQT